MPTSVDGSTADFFHVPTAQLGAFQCPQTYRKLLAQDAVGDERSSLRCNNHKGREPSSMWFLMDFSRSVQAATHRHKTFLSDIHPHFSYSCSFSDGPGILDPPFPCWSVLLKLGFLGSSNGLCCPKGERTKGLERWVSSNSVVFLKRGTGRRGCSSTCHMSGGVFSVWDLDVACRSCLQFDLAGLFSVKRRKFVCSSCGRKLLFLDVCTSTRRNTGNRCEDEVSRRHGLSLPVARYQPK